MPLISSIHHDAEADILCHKPHCHRLLNRPTQTKTYKKRMTSCKINTIAFNTAFNTTRFGKVPHSHNAHRPNFSHTRHVNPILIIGVRDCSNDNNLWGQHFTMPLPTGMGLTVYI
ncbi:hypothetical protein ACTXT7_017375, partial [Hymenolepis weldensis]